MGRASDQASRIIVRERHRDTQILWQLHKAEVIKNTAPEFFRCIGIRVRSYIDEFCAARPRSEITLEVGGSSLMITKLSLPSVSVELTLLAFGVRIWSREIKSNDLVREREHRAQFSIKRDGALYLAGSNSDVAARRALRPVFDAFPPSD